jgi:glycerol-3-phosphate O-acyltransferase/dihydroxyacetone phosphate acyltransferase
VHDALASSAAVGIFPEGVSHSAPSMVPLKTGAARIAFGALALTHQPIPIVPIGLVLRQKDVFRSEALAFTGGRVPWDDLAARGASDAAAVRALTDRIADALRRVTVNLEHWEDRPIVECAVRVWEAERGVPTAPAERVVRLDTTARILAEVRRVDDARGATLVRDVAAYDRRLRRLRLRPSDLVADVSLTRGVRWAAARLHLLLPLAVVSSFAGLVLFWPPYRATGWVVRRFHLEEDLRSTYKLLIGIPVYVGWLAALATGVVLLLEGWVAATVIVSVPVLGMTGLLFRERWSAAWTDARRFLLLRSRRGLVAALRERQRDLGARLDALQREYAAGGIA